MESRPVPDNVERQLGILIGKLDGMTERMDRADDGRKAMYDRIDDVARRQTVLEHQVANVTGKVDQVDGKVNKIQAVTDDVTIMRHKAAGAGTLGAWLMKFGGWILSGAGALVAAYTWLTGRPPP